MSLFISHYLFGDVLRLSVVKNARNIRWLIGQFLHQDARTGWGNLQNIYLMWFWPMGLYSRFSLTPIERNASQDFRDKMFTILTFSSPHVGSLAGEMGKFLSKHGGFINISLDCNGEHEIFVHIFFWYPILSPTYISVLKLTFEHLRILMIRTSKQRKSWVRLVLSRCQEGAPSPSENLLRATNAEDISWRTSVSSTWAWRWDHCADMHRIYGGFPKWGYPKMDGL